MVAFLDYDMTKKVEAGRSTTFSGLGVPRLMALVNKSHALKPASFTLFVHLNMFQDNTAGDHSVAG